MSRTQLDLLERFEEQVQNLIELCSSYDKGSEIVALSIATSIRVLLHDTQNSHSLFGQLKFKSVDFLDTASPEWEYFQKQISGERPVHLALCYKAIDSSIVQARFIPNFFNSFFQKTNNWISFDDWWKNSKIMISTNGESLSRWDLINGLSNKEGGAHVDKHGPGDVFDKFRHKYSGNISIKRNEKGGLDISNDANNPNEFDNKPIWASARQIAYELLETIKKQQLL